MADPRTSFASTSDFTFGGGNQRHSLVGAKPVILTGGTYLVSQIAKSYGKIELQTLAPDDVTWVPAYSWTSADTDGGLEVKFGALAIVRAVATGCVDPVLILAKVPA